MALATTSTFTMNVNDLVTEASARVGGEDITGFEIKSLRTSLNLMCAELSARGLNLWALDRQVINLVTGTPIYTLPSGTIDIQNMYSRVLAGFNRATATLTGPFTTTVGSASVSVLDANHGVEIGDFVIYLATSTVGGLTLTGTYSVTTLTDDNNYTITASSAATSTATGGGSVSVTYPAYLDTQMNRIAVGQYAQLASKSQPGRPTQYFVDRQITPKVHLFNTPNGTCPQVVYWRQRRLVDISTTTNNLEVPIFVLPAMAAWLAYKFAQKRPTLDAGLRAELKADAEMQLKIALDTDRDISPLVVVPDLSGYSRW
jgi:hypothetical protein